MRNFQEESIRLAGSKKMDIPSLARDIEMALENAVAEVDSVINKIADKVTEILAEKIPHERGVYAINAIINDYRSK